MHLCHKAYIPALLYTLSNRIALSTYFKRLTYTVDGIYTAPI